MELNGTITENRVDLGGTITKTKALSGALAPTGGGGSAVVTRGTGANSIVSVNSINPNTASGEEAIALGGSNQSTASGAMTIGTNNVASAQNAIAIGSKVNTGDPNTASGTAATAIGVSNTASGNGAVAIGYRCESTKIGSTAIGNQTHATGNAAVALGNGSTASGTSAVAAGSGATASSSAAVALGYQTAASAAGAFAANRETVAEAQMSSAFGYKTDATGARSLVAGAFNEPDTNEVDTTHGAGARKYAVIIGNGTADDARSNAATLDWDGNAVFAGKATVGAAPANDMDVATKKYVDDNAGGTSDYTGLTNKPQINGNTLTGDKTAAALGLATPSDIPAAASSGTPAMDGTASRGSSTQYARADHVHPSDTSKITAPSSPAAGAFLVWNGSAWAAQTLSTWQGGNY